MVAVDGNEESMWAIWVMRAMEGAGVTAAELERRSNGTITMATISKWRVDRRAPRGVETVINVAHLLGIDVVDALRAAGMSGAADVIEDARRRIDSEVPTLRATGLRISDLESRVRRNEADIEAVAGLAHKQQQAMDGTRDEVDRVRADVDALASEAGITDRALRGHIDDPRAHEHPDSGY